MGGINLAEIEEEIKYWKQRREIKNAHVLQIDKIIEQLEFNAEKLKDKMNR